MKDGRRGGRRANSRAFRPTMDGSLESRLVLSQAFHLPPATPGHVVIRTAYGGQSVDISDLDGDQFAINVTSDLPANSGAILTNAGTVRAFPMPGGKVGLILNGTTADSDVTINPINKPQRVGSAHGFSSGQIANDHLLDIGAIYVTSGQIHSIQGYHTAELSGPLNAAGASLVDRIAFASLDPGAAIDVGGTLNTLDILNGANLSGAYSGVGIGQDLNWFSVGQNVSLANGAIFVVGRDVGLVGQPAKGTGPQGQGGFINGNLSIAPGSQFRVGRYVDANISIYGNLAGSSRLFYTPGPRNMGVVVYGAVTP